MFNLLRRRGRRKHNNKNKYNIDTVQSSDDNVPKYSAKNHTNDESKKKITTTASSLNSGEYYRQICEENDEHNCASRHPLSEIAFANAGASITGTTSKPIRSRKTEEDEITDLENYLHVNDGKKTEQNILNAGKIYFENAQDKRRQLKKVEDAEKQQKQIHKKQVHLPQATDDFASTSTLKLEVNTDDDHYHDHQLEKSYAKKQEQIGKNEQRQRQQQPSTQKVEDVSCDRLACGFSHNELAERQRCGPTFGKYDEIFLNPTIEPTTSIATVKKGQIYNFKIFDTIENCENSKSTIINVEDVIEKNSYNYNKPKTSIKSEQNSTINNEVIYRNLDKTSRNEAKRQSRLSFTLAGISFGRKKEVDDRVKNDHDNRILEVSIKEAVPVVNNQTKINESKSKIKSVHNGSLGPLQKSREYLNNLFMARGRQHNRNQRHQQQQHSQQQASKQQQGKNDTSTNNGLGCRGVGGIVADKRQQTTMTSSSKNAINNTSEKAISLHLNATDSTNSYRIPSSKNNTTNFQTEVNEHTNREHKLLRSNSATHARRHSLSPQLSTKRSRSVTFSDVDHIIEDGRDLWLNRNVEKFSRTVNIVRGGGHLANNTANDIFAQESNNNAVNTHGVESSEKADCPTKSAYDHKNHHLIQTSSNSTTYENKEQQNNFYKSNKETVKDKGECLYNKLNQNNAVTSRNTYAMGQTNTKTETPSREFRESSVTSTTSDRVKKVSFADVPEAASSPININLPTITVADYSEALNSAKTTPSEQEVFYEFENTDKLNDRVNNMTVDNDIEHDANFYIGAAASSMSMNDQYNNNKWQTPNIAFLSQSALRNNYVKLEDVREEDEHEDEESNEEKENEESEDEESVFEEHTKRPRHLDNELYSSAERSPLKSSDTTLSGSPSDSGIGTDCQPTTPSNSKSRYSPTSFYPTTTTKNNNETTNIQQLKQQIKQQYGFMSFVRDGNSTDCDEIPLYCDEIDLDIADNESSTERLVCIESISLPDVVVESTAATASSTTLSSTSSTTSSDHIINISGASGNSMGNVHFIPIHIEGSSNSGNSSTTKRRSNDDSVIGNGTIEITEDASVMNGYVNDHRHTDKLK